jgi:DNA-binding transcriptional LysR family regulator
LGQLSDADWRLLRVFLAVVDCGGMTAAELELNISTSTISRHVKDLEARLGLVLCRRGRAGFALTPAGERIVAESRQLLAATERFRASVDELHQRLGGDVHVAVFDKTASNPQARMPQAVSAFRRAAPAVVLHLHVDTIQGIERGVMEGRYQMGVIPEHRRSDTLLYDDLFGEQMWLYAGHSHPLFARPEPLDWSDIRHHAFAGLGYHSPNMELSHRERLQRQATASDQESVATLILSGDFLGFLPDHYADTFVAKGLMRALGQGRLGYACRFALIVHKSPAPSAEVQLLHRCVVAAHQTQKSPPVGGL